MCALPRYQTDPTNKMRNKKLILSSLRAWKIKTFWLPFWIFPLTQHWIFQYVSVSSVYMFVHGPWDSEIYSSLNPLSFVYFEMWLPCSICFQELSFNYAKCIQIDTTVWWGHSPVFGNFCQFKHFYHKIKYMPNTITYSWLYVQMYQRLATKVLDTVQDN